MNPYIIARMRGRVFSFLLKDQKAVEIHCDPENAPEGILGNVYIGKVKNIAKNIQAAFVDIAPGRTCYLPLDDLRQPIFTKKGVSKQIQAGDELVVQVSREGIKTKFPSVTTNITFHGKFALLTTGKAQLSVSSKLGKEKREQLLSFLQEYRDEDGKYGWLLRTNAGSVSYEKIGEELAVLKNQYENLISQSQYRTCYSCLLNMPPAYLARLLDLYEESADVFLTDDKELYDEIQEYLTVHQPEDLSKLSFYEDRLLPMDKLYSLEHQLSLALQEKVWLNSGGYLIIQPTEAITVIDVNTGKYEGGKKQEKTFLKINKEAAIEIARQLRLRNISGIIIIDFINMEEKQSVDELLSLLNSELHKDPIPTTLVDMTKLSLVEITRKKKEKPLLQAYREIS